MLTRFSSRAVAAPARVGAALSSSLASSSFYASMPSSSMRWCSTEGKAEEAKPAEEPKKEEPQQAKATPESDNKQIKDLNDKIKKMQEENADLKKELQYTVADAQNARRIGREDTEKAKHFAVTGFAKDMLEVSDTLARAIEALDKVDKEIVNEHKALHNVLTGVKMSESVLQSAFNKHEIKKVECKPGTEFDPNHHDALFNAPATDEAPSGTITSVVKQGYTIKDRVLRAAQVGVAQ